MKAKLPRGRSNDESGYVLVTVAGLLVVMLGFTALAVDVGILYSARTQAQKAADAAALAAVFTFVSNPADASQPTTATNVANSTAKANKIMGDNVTADEIKEVSFECDPSPCVWTPPTRSVKRVTVRIEHTQSTYFAKIMNVFSADVKVKAVAEENDFPQCDRCSKPWFIPNNVIAADDGSGNELAPCAACTANKVLVDATGAWTTWGKGKVGTQFMIAATDPKGSLAPSQAYLVDLGNGANNYRSNISTCPGIAIICRNNYNVLTGMKVGLTTQGVDDLIGNPADTYVSPGKYQGSDGTYRSTSRSLVTAPIWDSCSASFCPAGTFPSGSTVSLQVIGFAKVFIEGRQGNGIQARLIDVSACGPDDPGGCVSGSSSFGHPIRLVRTP